MKIVSVNVGMPREIFWKGMTVHTGIFKDPVDGPVMIQKLNLAGDAQADLTVHGGVDKAVYAYPAEHYTYWSRELPQTKLSWGIFGENLTTEGLTEHSLFIGDHVKVGSAILAVTQPRLPCYKLGLRFGQDDIVKRFLWSGRSGFYFSVIEPGEVRAGNAIQIVQRDSGKVSVADINRLFLGTAGDSGLRERAMNLSALPLIWKTDLLARTTARS